MELKGRKESKMGGEEGRGGEEKIQVSGELLMPFKAASHRLLLYIQMKKLRFTEDHGLQSSPRKCQSWARLPCAACLQAFTLCGLSLPGRSTAYTVASCGRYLSSSVAPQP